MKCAITGKKIESTFLKKPLGTPIKHNGKTYWVSSEAQQQFKNNKLELVKHLS